MDSEASFGAFCGGMLLGAAIAAFVLSFKTTYEQGQIDAINGKIKYHLVEQPDKSQKWELIKEAK